MIPFIRIVPTRVLQFLGNLLKVFFLVHLKLFPNQRFIIPKYSKPLLKSKKSTLIPRKIWQTNYTKAVTLSVYFNYLWNRFIAPTFEHHYWSDDDCLLFIEQNFSVEIIEAFKKIQIGAAKADFWRTLVLLRHGGIYIDIDATLCYPPELFLSDNPEEFFVTEKNEELFLKERSDLISNYFLATKPEHPVFQKIVYQIQKNIESNQLTSIFEMTGPSVVHAIVKDLGLHLTPSRFICKQGVFIKKILQYPDKLKHYWVKEQENKSILK